MELVTGRWHGKSKVLDRAGVKLWFSYCRRTWLLAKTDFQFHFISLIELEHRGKNSSTDRCPLCIVVSVWLVVFAFIFSVTSELLADIASTATSAWCGLLLQMSHVLWSVCLAVLVAPVDCADANAKKTLNWSRTGWWCRFAWVPGTMWWVGVHSGATWRIRLNDSCSRRYGLLPNYFGHLFTFCTKIC